MPQPGKRGLPLRRITFVIVLALLAYAVWYYTRPKPLPVTLIQVARGTVEASVSNTRAGTVKACRRAKLAPPAGGQISQMHVKKGERVAAGQVLLELWDKDLQAQERLAVEQLRTSTTRAQEACATAQTAQRDAERSRKLKEKGFYSEQLLDRSLSEAQARQSACDAAHSEIAQSRSRISLARATMERTVLRAPFKGIVADISGELGEYATPSPPGILTLPAIDLIDDSCLFVSAPIDEVDAAHIKPGQVSRITLDAVKGKTYAGKVKRIAPYVLEVEKQARTVEVEVDFVEPPGSENLLVGYSADVEIIYSSHDQVLRIPTQTLLPTQTAQEGQRVLLYRAQDGVLEERTVRTGLSNWEHTEVVSGLNEGDQIVSSLDQAGVKAGVHVQPDTGVRLQSDNTSKPVK